MNIVRTRIGFATPDANPAGSDLDETDELRLAAGWTLAAAESSRAPASARRCLHGQADPHHSHRSIRTDFRRGMTVGGSIKMDGTS